MPYVAVIKLQMDHSDWSTRLIIMRGTANWITYNCKVYLIYSILYSIFLFYYFKSWYWCCIKAKNQASLPFSFHISFSIFVGYAGNIFCQFLVSSSVILEGGGYGGGGCVCMNVCMFVCMYCTSCGSVLYIKLLSVSIC